MHKGYLYNKERELGNGESLKWGIFKSDNL